jgi:hypothetical protein
MKMIEIRDKAKNMGITTKNVKKVDLIRKIQVEEGNQPCFQSKNADCGQTACCWREDCLV